MHRRISAGQVVVIVLTVLLAGALPAFASLMTSAETHDGDVGWSFPRMLTPSPTSAPATGGPSTPLRPLQQTAAALPLPPGTLSPDAFAGASIETTSELDRSRTMVTIFVPAGPRGAFRARVSGWGEQDFACDVVRPETKRIYCIGSRLPPGVSLVLVLIQTATGGREFAVFRASFLIPVLPASPTSPAGSSGSFPIPPTATRTAAPSQTQTPLPSATGTPIPPLPTDTHTPLPTDTNTPLPTDTLVSPPDTLVPPTNTPVPPPDTLAPPPDTPTP